jgi:hypothetical protein
MKGPRFIFRFCRLWRRQKNEFVSFKPDIQNGLKKLGFESLTLRNRVV